MYLKRQRIGGINGDRVILIGAAAPKFGYRAYYINYKEISIIFCIIYIKADPRFRENGYRGVEI